ncbi:uncharacterized protein LOC134787186 [Penaeus indicus]|uniref:uncharacterized protein LOC134787186 n=1 Tax=Penaeus indicus TaxID=29960 RepID=UPI00300C854C
MASTGMEEERLSLSGVNERISLVSNGLILVLLNDTLQFQGDNRCVKTDGSCSRQVGGARKKHFPKKIVKSRKESNVKSNSCASRKEDGDESDQGKSSSNKEVNSDNDSGKGSGLESESDDEDFRKRNDDEDLSSGKEDSDDSASPQRKKKDTGAKRREHDGEQECSDIDNDSPVDGSRTKRNDNTSHPLLLNNQKVIDIEILQPQIKEPQCCYQSLFRTKKNLKIAFGIAAVLTLLFWMVIMLPIARKIRDDLGFTSVGVKKNSYAASWQSQIQKSNSGIIDKNSIFAILQRAGVKDFSTEFQVVISFGGLVPFLLIVCCLCCCYKRLSKRYMVNGDHIPLATEENHIV